MKKLISLWIALAFATAIPASADEAGIRKVPLPTPPAFSIPKGVVAKKASLPIVGAAGQKDPSRSQNLVHLSNGNNEMIYVAMSMPNRIATPFAQPKIISVSDEDMSYEVIGQDVYIVPAREVPVGIFIVDEARQGGVVASLTLMPQNIPSQNIVLQFDQPATSVARGEQEAPASSDYLDTLRSVLRSVAQGAAPQGYAESTLKVGSVLVGGLTVIPDRQYIGQRVTVYRYRVENTTNETIELSEPAFNDKGVRAVAFWPEARLEPRGQTHVFVVADNDTSESRR